MRTWLFVLGTIVFGLLTWSGVASAQERCPFTITGEIAAGDPTQIGRLKNGPASTCAAPKTVPDLQAPIQPRRFDAYTLRNRSNAAACVTVTLTPTTAGQALSSAAYLAAFDPENPQASYLGDSGITQAATPYSFSVPALATFVVNVTEVGAGGGAYQLGVSDCGSIVATGITPNAGPVAGGTAVTITGSGFEPGAIVTIGGVPATNVVVTNDGTITALTPPGTPGPASVVVTNTDAASSTLTGAFVFVAPTETTLTLASSANPSVLGESVTFAIAATSGGGTPTGAIELLDGTTPIGTVALDGTGNASLTISTLEIGTHPITAVYAGNATFAAATSGVVSQVVTNARSATAMTASKNPTIVGDAVALTVVVSALPPATGAPTGTVTISKAGTPIAAATALDANGRATISTSSLPVGTHSLVAAYSGDTKYASSVSAPLALRVDARVDQPADGGASSSSGSSGAADAGTNEALGDASGGGGCDCRTAGGASASSAIAWALAALLIVSRRRRRG